MTGIHVTPGWWLGSAQNWCISVTPGVAPFITALGISRLGDG